MVAAFDAFTRPIQQDRSLSRVFIIISYSPTICFWPSSIRMAHTQENCVPRQTARGHHRSIFNLPLSATVLCRRQPPAASPIQDPTKRTQYWDREPCEGDETTTIAVPGSGVLDAIDHPGPPRARHEPSTFSVAMVTVYLSVCVRVQWPLTSNRPGTTV
ncbi:hypothetical protein GY45DRAFT_722122 [Cubamyces sp. BRFM 1775]|nr:hypothetical protein GY45DRAFT_722122 [Cubamyces sp. BRFM 1775]